MRIDLLQKRMEAMGLSQRDVAEQARISRSAFNRKMNGVSPFDVDEAMRVIYVLGIVEPEEIVEYMGSYDFKAWINEQISGAIGGERVEDTDKKVVEVEMRPHIIGVDEAIAKAEKLVDTISTAKLLAGELTVLCEGLKVTATVD